MSDRQRSALSKAREAYRRRAWRQACTYFALAESEAPLGTDDLDRHASAAFLAGDDERGVDLRTLQHRKLLEEGRTEAAVRAAFWLALQHVEVGDMAQAGGWLGRANRLITEHDLDCVEQGYLLVAAGLQAIESGDAGDACATFDRAERVAKRFADPDLLALSRLGRGQALAHLGDVADGMALLDEVMAAVAAGEISEIPAGIAYCALIETCFEVFDVARAQEWTEALSRWCESQPDLVAFRGQCLARRAEVMQLHGDWPEAEREASRALDLLAGRPAAGLALYVLAELRRLRGHFASAEQTYGDAHACGRMPHPGLSRLRLAQGRGDDARAALESVVGESDEQLVRAQMLAAYVEALLVCDRLEDAHEAADELAAMARALSSPMLSAIVDEAQGAVLLRRDDPKAAIHRLRNALKLWRQIEAPYEAARTQVHLARACRALGDEDGARFQLEEARNAFEKLGARPDLDALEASGKYGRSVTPGGLSRRELEVLRLVAAGKSNRLIAEELFISQKTVARHLSNIFAKLQVASRAAATSFAYEHDLLRS